jgi:uncharacterized protein YlaI
MVAIEPCAVCGEDTSLGRPMFEARRGTQRRNGTRVFLCSDCQARTDPERRHQFSEEERRRLDEHAGLFGIAFNATGH